MRYLPLTERDRAHMMRELGLKSEEELFNEIPDEVRFNGKLDIPGPLSELELARHVKELSQLNRSAEELVTFMGGGSYDHFIPSVIDHILSRGEFFTAYTPYQAEISQGTLQAIYEYQTMIAELTGMDAANASMYDGATALAEAALMAVSSRGRSKIVAASTINPMYLEVISTYIRGRADLSLEKVPWNDGTVDLQALEEIVDDKTAAVLVQQPNFFGNLEPVNEVSRASRDKGALFIVSADPISLGILKAPGSYGADIVVGEGQSLGNPQSWGGPGLGFFAAREKMLRRMPGRIVGATVDSEGRRGFVLTLQAREQHIRRERAASNICSNQALNALAATVYMSLLGKKGMIEVADLCLQKAHYARERITAIAGFEAAFEKPFFKEFTVRCPVPAAQVVEKMLEHGFLAGIDLGSFYPEMADHLLIAVTEKRTKEEIDSFATRLGELA